MAVRTIAHLSDLHIGRSQQDADSAVALRDAIIAANVDHVLVTGDVTDRGKATEYADFERIFGGLQAEGRLVIVPGNHDHLGDDVACKMMEERQVDLVRREGIAIIRVNSTAWHNKFLIAGHGKIDHAMLDEIERLLADVPSHELAVVMLHHHLSPLPEEFFFEHVAAVLRLPFAAELPLGVALLKRLEGRCDLVLHGHRHKPAESVLDGDRKLWVYNAGSSTELEAFRLFSHEHGALVGAPTWVQTRTTETTTDPSS